MRTQSTQLEGLELATSVADPWRTTLMASGARGLKEVRAMAKREEKVVARVVAKEAARKVEEPKQRAKPRASRNLPPKEDGVEIISE